MSDGPVTQSFFPDNTGTMGVYAQGAGSSTLIPTKVTYTSNLGTANINVSGSASSSQQIQQVPLFPTEVGFPLATTVEWYTIQAFDGSKKYTFWLFFRMTSA